MTGETSPLARLACKTISLFAQCCCAASPDQLNKGALPFVHSLRVRIALMVLVLPTLPSVCWHFAGTTATENVFVDCTKVAPSMIWLFGR